ncbi:hypothetical protein ABZV60_13145 [Streptomyces sp. NPDC004787]|uniref:hypothetical protein n=1 Tax=Streptomyces sp. NPDC004787 TaxID=3154291 RepID=UPI00339EDE95
MPDTPGVLDAVLDPDPARRERAVSDLYRLLLHQDRVFPATALAALDLSGFSRIRAPSPYTDGAGAVGPAAARFAPNC